MEFFLRLKTILTIKLLPKPASRTIIKPIRTWVWKARILGQQKELNWLEFQQKHADSICSNPAFFYNREGENIVKTESVFRFFILQ